MSDLVLPDDCKDHKDHVRTLWSWFEGNGNVGAKYRITTLEKLADGKEETASMTKIKSHLDWHEKSSKRRWELTVGIILVLVGQIATIVLTLLGHK